MAEKDESPKTGAAETTTASDVYGLLTSLVMHSDQLRWTRVNTLLVVDSIFLAAWAGLFAGTDAFSGKEALLALLCVPGVLLGLLFARLGWRSSQYMDDFHDLAHKMEEKFPESLPRPFHASEARRRGVRLGVERFTSSKWLIAAVPVMFTVLFVGLGVASFVMTP